MDVFTVLAEPKRRTIIEMLARHGQLSATAISQEFHVSTPAISQHLKILREADVVYVEKQAQQRIYRLNPATLTEMEDWIKQLRDYWNERFDALEKVLAVEKNKRKDVYDGR